MREVAEPDFMPAVLVQPAFMEAPFVHAA